ncbi:MAG TPA: hypothetical protein VJ276_14800 [Thermoanaerobaculia bacterium]|nr:hypothetical protein [Thermoanaerobaculia bacterium]
MIKRTIKPAAGTSRVTPEQAQAAARFVYRDSKTGRLVISKHEIGGRRSVTRRSKKR